MSDEEAHAALVSIKGVGPWTANIYLLMALKRPDIWPDGDIALATRRNQTSQTGHAIVLSPFGTNC
jgi:3-methyladenine DNA glycosylase/8-oxoguanine DNA glycosylase